MKKRHEAGFTLIEMLVVVAVIALLAAIAIPKYGESLRVSTEGYTRGSLGSFRRAMSIYYGDLDGQYPADTAALTQSSRFLRRIPTAKLPVYHADSSVVLNAQTPDDSGGWVYNNTQGSAGYGAVRVNCTHTDAKGSVWTSY